MYNMAAAERIKALRSEFGSYAIGGKEYVLIDQPFFHDSISSGLDGWVHDNYYLSFAFCPTDPDDDDGYRQSYTIRWDILDSYNPDEDGEDCACDWDNPSSVEIEEGYGYSARENIHWVI